MESSTGNNSNNSHLHYQRKNRQSMTGRSSDGTSTRILWHRNFPWKDGIDGERIRKPTAARSRKVPSGLSRPSICRLGWPFPTFDSLLDVITTFTRWLGSFPRKTVRSTNSSDIDWSAIPCLHKIGEGMGSMKMILDGDTRTLSIFSFQCSRLT